MAYEILGCVVGTGVCIRDRGAGVLYSVGFQAEVGKRYAPWSRRLGDEDKRQ